MKGTITRIISNLCTVNVNGNLYDCHPRGKFYHDGLTPLVGDRVKIDAENKYILEILSRTNSLTRPMIANVDACIIVTSVKKPDLSLNLLDKILCVIIHNKIMPIICFTKMDLLNSKEKKEIKKIIKYYNSIGINSVTNKDKRKLTKIISHKTVVLTGQTGAGKSSLLNILDKKLNLATNEISEALGRGKHTTRHVELFAYKTSLIADTPGFSSLDLNQMTKEEIKKSFIEFNLGCEYDDCNHLKETGCKVKEAIEKGKILNSRYENYEKFVRENENSRIIYKK